VSADGPADAVRPPAGLPISPTAVDHVGIAVNDLDAAARQYAAFLGDEPVYRHRGEDQGVEEVLFRIGGTYIQLVAPLGPETPVGRFLAKRGEGVHHVGYRVDDVAAALDALRAAGVPLVDEAPRPGSRGTTIAFVHPKGFRGVLVELVQEPADRPA
jgi:methylmalonyl-CoA/ethylmalonyl-CoA epimerase